VFRVHKDPPQTLAFYIPDRYEQSGRYSPSTGAFAAIYFGGGYRRKLDLPGFELEFDSTRIQVFRNQLSSSFLWLSNGYGSAEKAAADGLLRMSADVRRFGRTPPLALVTKEPVQGFEVYVVDSRTPVERPVVDIRATREAFVGASDDKKESSAVQQESVEDTELHLFPSIESASETDIAEKARLERNLKRLRGGVQLEGPRLRDVVGFIERMTSAFKLEAALDIFGLVSSP
jgi:hypothetical protein